MQILMSVMMATFMSMMIPRAIGLGRAHRRGARHRVLRRPSRRSRSPHPARRGGRRAARRRLPLPGRRVAGAARRRRSRPSRAARPPSSGRPAPARRPCSPSSRGSTTSPAGTVRVGGVDVRDARRSRTLWARIGLVPQKPYLFTGTVASQPALRRPRRHRRRAVGGAAHRPGRGLRPGDARRPRRRRSPRAAPTSPAASASGWPSPGPSCSEPEIYLFDDSFSALDLSTDARLRRGPAAGHGAERGRHRGPAGVDDHRRRPASSSSTTAGSSGQGTHDELARHLRDLRRDRRVPAQRGGGGLMAEGVKTTEEKAAEARRGPARRGGPPHMQMGQPAEKSQNFGPSAKRLLGLLRPRAGARSSSCSCWPSSASTLSSVGPKILGRATDLIFAGVHRQAAAARRRPARRASRSSPACAPGARRPSPTCWRKVDFVPGPGHRLRRARQRAPARPRRSSPWPRCCMWVQGWMLTGRARPHDVPPAPGRRGQAQPAAAALLRQAAAR